MSDLEGYALRPLGHATALGVHLAARSIAGTSLIHDDPWAAHNIGRLLAEHDWTGPALSAHHVPLPPLDGEHADDLLDAAIAQALLTDGSSGVVIGSPAVGALGTDPLDELTSALASQGHVALVSTTPVPDGLHVGWANTLLSVARSLPWGPPEPGPVASVMGFLHHSFEADQTEDLAVLRGLIQAAGVQAGPIWFSGTGWDDLARAPSASIAIQLPYARPVARPLKKLMRGRTVVQSDLPMGLRGTERWVRQLAAAAGTEVDVDAWVATEKAATTAGLAHFAHHRLRSLSVAIIADTPLAAGLASIMADLGVRVRLIGLRDKVLGGRRLLRKTLEADGHGLEGTTILQQPGLRTWREAVLPLIERHEVSAVIGSGPELATLRHSRSLTAAGRGVALLETGFPTARRHAARARSSFGFAGVVAWAQALVDATLAPQVGSRPRPAGRQPAPSRRSLPARLDSYALKGLHLAKMTGVSLATHAIRDGFLLQHVGVGCKYKAAAQVALHDWGAHPNRREAWTQVGEIALIRGSGARIGPFARTWYERRRPGIMLLVSAYFIELTGESVLDIVQETERTLPCDMGVVQTAAPNGGFFDGYAAVMLEVVKKGTYRKRAADLPEQVTTLGFFFHRYEEDQAADIAELRSLITLAGRSPGPVLFSGVPYGELKEGWRSGTILQLPYARPAGKKLARQLKGRDVRELDLPIGIAGTAAFVRGLAPDAPDRLAASVVQLRTALAPLLPTLAGLRVGLLADTPLAAGLAGLLMELGVDLQLLATRDVVLGGLEAVDAALARQGAALPGHTLRLEQPSVRTVREQVLSRCQAGELDVVIGSSVELAALARAHTLRALLTRTALIEVGYPTNDAHGIQRTPTLGLAGVLAWAQRLADATVQGAVADRLQLRR